MNEVEVARRQFGKLNTIVMNAVLEACVRCGDIDSAIRIFVEMKKGDGCGVDTVTYATLLKVLYWSSYFRLFLFSFSKFALPHLFMGRTLLVLL